jgi:CBS domain-containing protein
MGRRTCHVSHPILRLSVVGPDGVPADRLQVFCRLQKTSVPVGVCVGCFHCDAVTGGSHPAIECTISLPESETVDRLGETTAVGSVLSSGASVVADTCMLHDAVRLLGDGPDPFVGVVDEADVLVGIVHEMSIASGPDEGKVDVAMTSPVVVPENLPVRAALRVLAAAHSRAAVVVDREGHPLGVFRDIDGMRWLVRASR